MLDQSLDTLMRLIWQTTLVLVAVGLLIMAALIVRRLLEESKSARHRPARERLRRSLLAGLNRPADMLDAFGIGLPLAEIARLVDELAQIVRGEARRRLAAFASDAGVEHLWLSRLGSRMAPLRLDAARCLTLFETKAVREALLARLTGRDTALRLAAAEALAHDPSLAADITARLAKDPAALGRRAARLWHRLAVSAPQTLAEWLQAVDAEPRLLIRLIEALAEVGHVAAAGPIESLVGRYGAAFDQAALAALDRLNHPAVVRVARNLATSSEGALRRAALGVLGHRAKIRDLELLAGLTSDPLPDIAAAARTLITRLAASDAAGASPA